MFEQDKIGSITYHQFARIRKHDHCQLYHKRLIEGENLRYEVIDIPWFEKYKEQYLKHDRMYQIWKGQTKVIVVYF